MTREELLAEYNQHIENKELCNADLSNIDFSDSLWCETKAMHANLQNTNFKYAELADVKLVGSDLTGASFHSAKLSDVDLSKANLKEVSFYNADLENVELCDAVIDNIDIRACSMKNVSLPRNMYNVQIEDATILYNVETNQISFVTCISKNKKNRLEDFYEYTLYCYKSAYIKEQTYKEYLAVIQLLLTLKTQYAKKRALRTGNY